MECKTFSHIDNRGEKRSKLKRRFNRLDEAIAEAKRMNSRPHQITKLVAYKCKECHHYHIGRTGKTLTFRDRARAAKTRF